MPVDAVFLAAEHPPVRVVGAHEVDPDRRQLLESRVERHAYLVERALVRFLKGDYRGRVVRRGFTESGFGRAHDLLRGFDHAVDDDGVVLVDFSGREGGRDAGEVAARDADRLSDLVRPLGNSRFIVDDLRERGVDHVLHQQGCTDCP